jgi:uncharacterized protein YbcV (DUF1398 family)
MKADVSAVLRKCSDDSDEGSVPFPAIVKRLIDAGVERYHADLVRAEKTYYLPNGDSETIPNNAVGAEVATNFSAQAVEAAVRAVQAGKIRYKQFCSDVMVAGCVGYIVSMPGRRAVYYGRTGESHVEHFPGAP